ncbi:MAG TPA: hypothetical protein PK095_00525 [Myxococcota bacterium]|nr:hypothetical protein [Myxococcota bacterium]
MGELDRNPLAQVGQVRIEAALGCAQCNRLPNVVRPDLFGLLGASKVLGRSGDLSPPWRDDLSSPWVGRDGE